MKHDQRASVLMYHALESPDISCGLQDRGELIYVIDESRFRLHMTLIEKSGARVILPGDSLSSSGRGDIILTFDDGHSSGYSVALPILSASGLNAVFFITTGWTGKDHYLTRDEIKKLYDSGMMIGSHGISHRFMTDLTDNELAAELTGSKKTLESIIGKDVTSFSAPGGRIDRRVIAAAVKAGYRWIFSSEPAGNLELTEGIPIGRFAVTAASGDEWLSRIVSGNPPRSALVKYRTLSMMKRLLGNRLYESIRGSILGND
ncbi:MAG: polysaccharide deacetylase family protein [Candidatus Krumholzibacteria bacterium]|nr:polysaccharide deacetylase family protein [Candidatus Krumholzibacteria bacterium]